MRPPAPTQQGLGSSMVIESGPEGDRALAFVHAETGEVATPERKKQWHPAPLDWRVLMTLIATQERQFGVLCRVGWAGQISENDEVHLL